MANIILSQDKKYIFNTDALEFMSIDKVLGSDDCQINAHTISGTLIALGKYESEEAAEKVMGYIVFLSTSESQEPIMLPPNDIVMRTSRGTIDLDVEKILMDILGGERK